MDENAILGLANNSYFRSLGKVVKVVGLTIESVGPEAKLKDLCLISRTDSKEPLMAGVVGFKDKRLLLMPFEDVEGVAV